MIAIMGWALRILAGPGAGRRVVLTERLTIGRDANAGLGIPDQGLSRTHAEVMRSAAGWTVSDLGSSNGTLLDGVTLAAGEPRALAPGSWLRVGHVLIVVEAGIPELPEIARHRILGLLGAGSLGNVYAALDADGAQVAIKIPVGPIQAARLRNGAVRRIELPGVIPAWILEGGAAASPWQDLGSLEEHLAAGTMDGNRATTLAIALVDALAALEAEGVQPLALHPGNVLRGRDGRWRIADALTAAPIGLGDRRGPYMAPELAEGRAADAVSVQYSLGVMLHRALLGTVPTTGLIPALDPADTGTPLASVVPRLCAERPDSRYATWEEVAATLTGRLTIAPVGSRPEKAKTTR